MLVSATAQTVRAAPNASVRSDARPMAWRALLIALAAAGLFAGLEIGTSASTRAVVLAGPELTRVLRAMALLKALFVIGAMSAIVWRLRAPVTWARFAGYAVSCCAMTVGIGEIWRMTHVGAGALLLHGGLLACILLLWRDPALERLFLALLAARRAKRETATPAVPVTPTGGV